MADLCICHGTQDFDARCELCSCRGEIGLVCVDDPCACVRTDEDDA
jgi:hypothetical protein